MIKCGLVGLPNVGKSTIFNILTKSSQPEGNYPFCTINKFSSLISVKDSRLSEIHKFFPKSKLIFPLIEIVDIAGIIKNAHKDEGLGNKFLSDIKEVDVIIHVVRCFESSEILRVDNSLHAQPLCDIEIVNQELFLKDIEDLEKISTSKNPLKKEAEYILSEISKNKEISSLPTDIVSKFNLLSVKPRIYLCNISEHILSKEKENIEKIAQICKKENSKHICLCAREEKQKVAQNITSSNVEKFILQTYSLLDIITFFTAGNDECRGWQVKKNSFAHEAGKVIHSDFKDHFINVEKINYKDFIQCKGYENCKKQGKVNIKGKDYVVESGDILNFKSYIAPSRKK